jgi:hypothetical protein
MGLEEVVVVRNRANSVEALEMSEIPTLLDSRRAVLEHRLEDGYVRIDEAVASGTDVSEWESFWVRLLREYEDVCRELDIAA